MNYHHIYGGEAESRKSNYTDLVLSILHLNILGLLASIKFINVFCFRTEDQICQFLLCESGKQVLWSCHQLLRIWMGWLIPLCWQVNYIACSLANQYPLTITPSVCPSSDADLFIHHNCASTNLFQFHAYPLDGMRKLSMKVLSAISTLLPSNWGSRRGWRLAIKPNSFANYAWKIFTAVL